MLYLNQLYFCQTIWKKNSENFKDKLSLGWDYCDAPRFKKADVKHLHRIDSIEKIILTDNEDFVKVNKAL